MSLIIQGMKLPTTGRVDISIDAKGKIYSKTPGLAFWKYSAVEIPTPHGRLIDADKLKEKRETMCWKDEFYMTHESDFIDSRYIANAPTILEAEE